MNLPPNYIEGVTRVSSLVEHKFPFEGTEGQKRYLQWLKKNNVDEKEYIDEACTVGTYIHLQMEKFIEGQTLNPQELTYNKHMNEIENGLQFMKDYNLTDMETEIYCRDKYNRYQGSIDLLANNDEGKRILIDWKTWGIAKKRFGLPNGHAKPYDKLKKVALQMSLYAKALGNIDEIWVVWLHKEGYFVYKLEITEDTELEELILSHQTRNLKLAPDSNLTINYDPMEIKIQTTIPNLPYSVASVTLDASDCDNGDTVEQNIKRTIDYQKVLVGKYKEING